MTKSSKLFKQALKLIPGGVNSPVRAFKHVGLNPIFAEKGKGANFTDADGKEYLDYCLSWGPLILGHADKDVVKAIQEAAAEGTSFGISTEKEIRLAELIQTFYPSMEKLRLVNSGTEATMTAIRLARAYTGKNVIIKFDGCYHGHTDSLLVGSGSGVLTMGLSSSAGVPKEFITHTVSLPFNDISAFKTYFKKNHTHIAGVIIEPVAGNMGLVLPKGSFLKEIEALCQKHGALLIFDEILCGFRVHPQGAQGLYDITPDLTCLGKVIGGGLPVGAYGGRHDIMDMIAPSGNVYQAGTLSGNPLAVSAGIATLNKLKDGKVFLQAQQTCHKLADGIRAILNQYESQAQIVNLGSIFCLFFSRTGIHSLEESKQCDTQTFSQFFQHLLKNGVYWPPSQFEACFTSSRHSPAHIEHTLNVIEGFFRKKSRG